MYYVIAFQSKDVFRKIWIRGEEQVVGLLKEGFMVYRTGTDQYAYLTSSGFIEDAIAWIDVKEFKAGEDR